MPFKSRAQIRRFRQKERDGEFPKGTVKKWLEETRAAGIDPATLPNRLHKKRKKQSSPMKKIANVLYGAFIKAATVGTNSSTALSGVKPSRPAIGTLKVPKRLVIGTARGFDPRASVDGLKDRK